MMSVQFTTVGYVVLVVVTAWGLQKGTYGRDGDKIVANYRAL
jgi:hypothetical protein